MRKYLFLLLILGISLQGCFYIHAGKSWGGIVRKNKKEYNDTSNINLSVYIGLGKQSKQVTVPFFFIEKDKKGPYGISFSLITSDIHYKEIDSLSYEIYNHKDSLVLKGSIKDSNSTGIFKYMKIYKDSTFVANEKLHGKDSIRLVELINSLKKHPEYDSRLWTGYILKLAYKSRKNLIINFTLYVTTDTNQKIKLKFRDCILKKSKRGMGLFTV